MSGIQFGNNTSEEDKDISMIIDALENSKLIKTNNALYHDIWKILETRVPDAVKHVSHPFMSYPKRFKRIFNNFMMSSIANPNYVCDYGDSVNWSNDMRSYGMHKVFEEAGLQLPSFDMAKKVFEKHGYVQE